MVVARTSIGDRHRIAAAAASRWPLVAAGDSMHYDPVVAFSLAARGEP
jgi:hypothetical protein